MLIRVCTVWSQAVAHPACFLSSSSKDSSQAGGELHTSSAAPSWSAGTMTRFTAVLSVPITRHAPMDRAPTGSSSPEGWWWSSQTEVGCTIQRDGCWVFSVASSPSDEHREVREHVLGPDALLVSLAARPLTTAPMSGGQFPAGKPTMSCTSRHAVRPAAWLCSGQEMSTLPDSTRRTEDAPACEAYVGSWGDRVERFLQQVAEVLGVVNGDGTVEGSWRQRRARGQEGRADTGHGQKSTPSSKKASAPKRLPPLTPAFFVTKVAAAGRSTSC